MFFVTPDMLVLDWRIIVKKQEAHRTENYCLTIFSLIDTPPVHQYIWLQIH